MSLVETKARPKSSAPGQYLGYALQPVRFCYYLLHVPDGYSVSLEILDDIAVHAPTGALLLEQTKSALTGKLLANKSTDLWKTFGNWADQCANGSVSSSTTKFYIYAAPPNPGPLAKAINDATTTDIARHLLTQIRKLVKKGTENIGCNPHIIRFLNAGDEICLNIMLNFRLVGHTDPIEGIREYLRAVLPPNVLDDFCSAAIGQAKDEVDRLIREKKPALIAAVDFRRKFQTFVRKHNLANLLLSTTQPPTEPDIAAVISSSPLFVRQLEAVEVSSDLLMTAVSDYLRTTADKISWAADGIIVDESLTELDTALERRHKLAKDEIDDVYSLQTPIERGRMLYRRCIETQLPLEGRTLPSYFVPGEYNFLADILRVVWHPQYTIMFADD